MLTPNLRLLLLPYIVGQDVCGALEDGLWNSRVVGLFPRVALSLDRTDARVPPSSSTWPVFGAARLAAVEQTPYISPHTQHTFFLLQIP